MSNSIKVNDLVTSKMDGSVKPCFIDAVVVEVIETTFQNIETSPHYNWRLEEGTVVKKTEFMIESGDQTLRITEDAVDLKLLKAGS